MKKLIKKLIPVFLKDYRNKKISKFNNKNPHEAFTEIYNTNHWMSMESNSGMGSELIQTKTLITELGKLIADINIESVLDIPCGDFKWMQKVDLSKIDYIGADIVEELIEKNTILFKERDNLTFKVLNLIKDPLPAKDIVIIRDCLVHLSYKDIYKALKNVKSSGCKYLLTTTFTNHNLNNDIATGEWRPLNLQKRPFNFPNPILVINENCTEGNGNFKDKSLALWEISKLNNKNGSIF